jgi:hypothetical protein
MGKDWRKEFDDLLKARKGRPKQPDAADDKLLEAPAETQPPETIEPEPVPEPIAQEQIESAPGAEESVEEAAPPVLVEPASLLDDLSIEAAMPDTLMRSGFSRAVERMFHELINQLGQVREMARRRVQAHGLWLAQQDDDEERMLKEEEDAFSRAVEKMFRDVRENLAERLRRITEEERQTAAALEEAGRQLEHQRQELGRAQSDLESAQSRVRELGSQMEQLLDQIEAKPSEEYVAELEKHLVEAYVLLNGIEETFLVVEADAVT